jgi:hypothetical protein
VVVGVVACDSPKTYSTTVEVLQVERFGESPPNQVGLELRYSDCPGDARRVIRADKAFAQCAPNIKEGDKLKAEIATSYVSERGAWRSDITKLGDCAMKLDPKEEANFEMVQTCTEIKTTGSVVGVRCDRTRNKDMVTKCPWLKRR